jgi:hypothetical protein
VYVLDDHTPGGEFYEPDPAKRQVLEENFENIGRAFTAFFVLFTRDNFPVVTVLVTVLVVLVLVTVLVVVVVVLVVVGGATQRLSAVLALLRWTVTAVCRQSMRRHSDACEQL